MNLPSRGERESAATTRNTGFFFDPTRVNLSLTAKPLPPGLLLFSLALGLSGRGRAGAVRRARCRQSWQGRHLPAAHLLHQLRHLLASLEQDRKSTRLNSSHTVISYAVFCLKKKTI